MQKLVLKANKFERVNISTDFFFPSDFQEVTPFQEGSEALAGLFSALKFPNITVLNLAGSQVYVDVLFEGLGAGKDSRKISRLIFYLGNLPNLKVLVLNRNKASNSLSSGILPSSNEKAADKVNLKFLSETKNLNVLGLAQMDLSTEFRTKVKFTRKVANDKISAKIIDYCFAY